MITNKILLNLKNILELKQRCFLSLLRNFTLFVFKVWLRFIFETISIKSKGIILFFVDCQYNSFGLFNLYPISCKAISTFLLVNFEAKLDY